MQKKEADLLLLLRSALNQTVCDVQLDASECTAVYELACKQGVETTIATHLLAMQNLPPELAVAIRERIMLWTRTFATRGFYADRVKQELSRLQMRYIPLKGAVFAKYYPKESMRTSSDLDLLCDGDVKAIEENMQAIGATKWEHGKEHSCYLFGDALVELHPALVPENTTFYPYFSRVWERAIPTEGMACQMTAEDQYLYHLAHMVKHMLYSNGIGIRALCDLYLFLQKEPLDRTYTTRVLQELHLLDFAENMEELAVACFDSAQNSIEEKHERWLSYFMFGTMFGEKSIGDTLRGRGTKTENGKLSVRYYFARLFPPYRDMVWLFPCLKKAKVLLPFFYVFRLLKALIFGRKKVKKELQAMQDVDTKKLQEIANLYEEIGIYAEKVDA